VWFSYPSPFEFCVYVVADCWCLRQEEPVDKTKHWGDLEEEEEEEVEEEEDEEELEEEEMQDGIESVDSLSRYVILYHWFLFIKTFVIISYVSFCLIEACFYCSWVFSPSSLFPLFLVYSFIYSQRKSGFLSHFIENSYLKRIKYSWMFKFPTWTQWRKVKEMTC